MLTGELDMVDDVFDKPDISIAVATSNWGSADKEPLAPESTPSKPDPLRRRSTR